MHRQTYLFSQFNAGIARRLAHTVLKWRTGLGAGSTKLVLCHERMNSYMQKTKERSQRFFEGGMPSGLSQVEDLQRVYEKSAFFS